MILILVANTILCSVCECQCGRISLPLLPQSDTTVKCGGYDSDESDCENCGIKLITYKGRSTTRCKDCANNFSCCNPDISNFIF